MSIQQYRKSTYWMLRLIILTQIFFVPSFSFAATSAQTISVSSLMPQSTIFFSPRSGTFTEGSSFNVSVFVDSKKKSINTIDVLIKFDPSELQIIDSLGGKSIIGLWVTPPVYSNTNGTIHLVGTIPNGIVTDSGLITTVTFKAINSGNATVSISEQSEVLANDGLGSGVLLKVDAAHYVISPAPPGGVRVFSETHPFSDKWYNNNSPTFAWEKDEGVGEFSYTFDDKPFSIPDNQTSLTKDTVRGYENVMDGVWYFHIKAKKQGVWGATTHFPVRIDTAPPAKFTPTVDILSAAVIRSRGMVSFFTTDTLSGVDHYEVGVIPEGENSDASPAYIEAQSPYEIPGYISGSTKIVVRAFDRAGNITSASVQATPDSVLKLLVKHNALMFGLAFLIAVIILLIGIILFQRRIRLALRRLVARELGATKAELLDDSPPVYQIPSGNIDSGERNSSTIQHQDYTP